MIEVDISRAADLMTEMYGQNAVAEAIGRAHGLDLDGDEAGAAAWREIARAIEKLLRSPPDGRVH